jgi:hypothetical protein
MDCASAFGSFFENRLWLDSSCDKDLDDTQFCWSPSTRKYLRANMYEKCLVGTGFREAKSPRNTVVELELSNQYRPILAGVISVS